MAPPRRPHSERPKPEEVLALAGPDARVHADDPVGRACSASAWSPCRSKLIRLAAARPPSPSISCTPTAASASSTRNAVPFTALSLRLTSSAASSTLLTSTW